MASAGYCPPPSNLAIRIVGNLRRRCENYFEVRATTIGSRRAAEAGGGPGPLTRLETHRAEILAFFEDVPIPCDRNAAERAPHDEGEIESPSDTGGTLFATIRSYLAKAM